MGFDLWKELGKGDFGRFLMGLPIINQIKTGTQVLSDVGAGKNFGQAVQNRSAENTEMYRQNYKMVGDAIGKIPGIGGALRGTVDTFGGIHDDINTGFTDLSHGRLEQGGAKWLNAGLKLPGIVGKAFDQGTALAASGKYLTTSPNGQGFGQSPVGKALKGAGNNAMQQMGQRRSSPMGVR